MVDCDVVIFKNPSLECSVFVTNVPNSVEEEQLFNLFGKCGLVYDVHKFSPENLKRKAGMYEAFLIYYIFIFILDCFHSD
jgi:hypothetical protein